MEDFLLDPTEATGASRNPCRTSDLRERVLCEARERARSYDLRLVVEPAQRASDLVMLWFQGERSKVLAAVGAWEPEVGVVLQIAHAGQCAGRYELVLFAAAARVSDRRAA